MVDLNEIPFAVVPIGLKCKTKPTENWNIGDTSTYIYCIGSVSYFAVFLHPKLEFPEGFGATITGQTTMGNVMHDQYFIGDLRPGKSSCLVKTSATGPERNGINVFINVRPLSDVDGYVKDLVNLDRQEKGPFMEMK